MYGNQVEVPFCEDMPVEHPTDPYGRSKLMTEDILQDLAVSDSRRPIALFRYLNPVDAHESGPMIGEDPKVVPNNLLPDILKVAIGKLPELSVFGDDCSTQDGTGVRGYILLVDLADGHLQALHAIQDRPGVSVWNLGTGIGQIVLEIVRAFEQVSGRRIPVRGAP